MNANCYGCNGAGYTSIKNGDDDQQCPICKGAGLSPSPAPVTVEIGPYKATVEHRGSFVHLTNTFLSEYQSLINSFRDPDEALVLGRALVTACRPASPKTSYIGWDWNFGEVTNVGWLLLNLQQIPLLPDTMLPASAYECGIALVQLGAILKARHEIVEWIGLSNMPQELAV